ncbi:MAG: AAA family ATPase, partial [Bacteroidia bacterium]
MKIKELKLHPFAGTRNRTVNFTPGLNVILGANEAGKSTLIKGLSCLFFTEPNLTQSKFDKELKSFLPLSGGDTIRISADIDLQGENYHVEKEFGAVKRAQLILPTNAELNNITDVQKQLLDKLGFSKATYEQVLITHQSDLANTIKALREEKDGTKAHLSNRLRSKLYELDGISVEKLKTEIDKLVEDYFDNWDDENNRPAKGKDFDNPHLKNVKRILRAYYTYRKLEKQLADAERYEKEIDLVNAQLQVKNKKYEELVSYKTQFAPVVEDARKRHEFETNRKMLQHEKTAIAEVAEKWPVEQDKFREAKRKSEELSQVSKGLDTNIKSLKQYQKSQELRTLYEKAKILCDEFVTEQENFKLIPQVNNDHINHVRKLERELDKLKNIIEAQELKIAIRAKKDISFGLKRGLNAAENISFSEGEMIQYDAAGRIQIEHEDFTIAIVSGKADIKQILKDIETKQAEIAAYFKEWNVENLDALDKLKADFDKAGLHIQSKHNEIKKLLNGQKLVDLEKEVSAIEKPHIAESLEMLQAQFNELQKQLAELQTIERYAAKQLQEWEMKFTSKDNLLDK